MDKQHSKNINLLNVANYLMKVRIFPQQLQQEWYNGITGPCQGSDGGSIPPSCSMKYLLAILLFISSHLSAQDKVKFIATGVTCSMCSNAIHKSLKTDKSITKIDPNLETQEWFLEYKTGEFKTEELIKRVEDAGFSISKIYLNDILIFDKSRKKKKKHIN